MPKNTFDILTIIARPAAGKSETIRCLRSTPVEERVRRFHIGPFDEFDDFPMLWAWFEEDNILERLGHSRLHTTPDNYFKNNVLWHVLIEQLSLAYTRVVRDQPSYHETRTAILEFSRGAPSGGYREAFQHLSEEILKRTGVMYIDVSYEESLRKNRGRFNPERPDSILEHGLSDEKMERAYREDDFAEFAAADPCWLTVKDIKVPYVIFDNHDDVTTGMGEALAKRLEDRLGVLWELYQSRRS